MEAIKLGKDAEEEEVSFHDVSQILRRCGHTVKTSIFLSIFHLSLFLPSCLFPSHLFSMSSSLFLLHPSPTFSSYISLFLSLSLSLSLALSLPLSPAIHLSPSLPLSLSPSLSLPLLLSPSLSLSLSHSLSLSGCLFVGLWLSNHRPPHISQLLKGCHQYDSVGVQILQPGILNTPTRHNSHEFIYLIVL